MIDLNKTSEQLANEIMWKFFSNEKLNHLPQDVRLQFAATQSLISLEGQIEAEENQQMKDKLIEVFNLIKN